MENALITRRPKNCIKLGCSVRPLPTALPERREPEGWALHGRDVLLYWKFSSRETPAVVVKVVVEVRDRSVSGFRHAPAAKPATDRGDNVAIDVVVVHVVCDGEGLEPLSLLCPEREARGAPVLSPHPGRGRG